MLQRGVNLVCYSGDKILGGPQAGIIAGDASLVNRLKKEPFFRALRCDKLVLAALEATAETYLRASSGKNLPELPLLRMLAASACELTERAHAICEILTGFQVDCSIGKGEGRVGGGTMPRSSIPSVTLDLKPHGVSLETFARRLRLQPKPIVGHLAGEVFKIDLRTVFPWQDRDLTAGLQAAARPEKT